MLIKELEKKYSELSNTVAKDKLVESIMKRTYAPILEKKLILDTQLSKCILERDGVEYVDDFLSKVNLVFSVVSLYTNLDILHKDESDEEKTNLFDDYDLLMSSGVFDLILTKIGEREITELMSIKSSIEDTFMNQQTTEFYIGKQVTRFATLFGMATDSGLNQLSEVLKDDKKMNGLVNKIKKMLNETSKNK